ncbi:MAG TPA: hypothetical protein VIJ00_03120, partial [Nakamurella sp.]
MSTTESQPTESAGPTSAADPVPDLAGAVNDSVSNPPPAADLPATDPQAGARAAGARAAGARAAGARPAGPPPAAVPAQRAPAPFIPAFATGALSPADEERRRRLNRMKLIATGALVLMAIIFVIAFSLQDRYPWLGYVRATAEAGMVGALADWFAVTAL